MLALIALLIVGVFVPWGILFLMWRWLHTDAVARLKRARLVVAILGAIAVIFAFLRHDTSGAIITALVTLLVIAVLSGWLRRILMWVGILLLVFAACAGWLAYGSIHGVMTTPGGSVLGWVSVALTSMLTWLLLGGGVLCVWLARRPIIPLGSPAPPPAAPPPAPPITRA